MRLLSRSSSFDRGWLLVKRSSSSLPRASVALPSLLNVCAQLLFPVLMVVLVWRIIAVRVRPNDLLVFRLHGSDGEEGGDDLAPQEGVNDQASPQPQAEDGGIPSTADGDTRHAQRGLWQKVRFLFVVQERFRSRTRGTCAWNPNLLLRYSVALAAFVLRTFSTERSRKKSFFRAPRDRSTAVYPVGGRLSRGLRDFATSRTA